MKDFTVVGNVPAKKDKDGKEITKALSGTVVIKFPITLKEAKEVYGEQACLSNMLANWRVVIQGNIRSRLRKGALPDQIAKELATAKMGVASSGGAVDPQAAFIAKFKLSTPEEQAKMIMSLKAEAAAD